MKCPHLLLPMETVLMSTTNIVGSQLQIEDQGEIGNVHFHSNLMESYMMVYAQMQRILMENTGVPLGLIRERTNMLAAVDTGDIVSLDVIQSQNPNRLFQSHCRLVNHRTQLHHHFDHQIYHHAQVQDMQRIIGIKPEVK